MFDIMTVVCHMFSELTVFKFLIFSDKHTQRIKKTDSIYEMKKNKQIFKFETLRPKL